MQAPTWRHPAIMGTVAGGIITVFLGFNQGGWYLGSSAERMADQRAAAAITESACAGLCRPVASGPGING